MLPPQPQLSLPTPKYVSFHGFSRPLERRRFAIGESASDVMYSTHCAISCTEPLPRFPQTYGSAPSCSQKSKNSCVPNAFDSFTPPQWLLVMLGRLSRGPMPSIQ